jgi:hypothetical protein
LAKAMVTMNIAHCGSHRLPISTTPAIAATSSGVRSGFRSSSARRG